MRIGWAPRRAAHAGITAIVVLVLVANDVAAGHIPFNTSIVVRAATFEPGRPDLAAYGTQVVVGWAQQLYAPIEVWAARSTNGGTTFGTAQRLAKNSANPGRDLSVFSGPSEHLAVWSEAVAGGGSRIFLSRTGTWTGPWSAATQVSTNSGTSFAILPTVVASGGVLVVTYLRSSTTFGPYTAYARVKVGNAPWSSATALTGGAAERPVSLAVSTTRLLVAWATSNGQMRLRRGLIGNTGTSFSWLAGDIALGTGLPTVVMAGTRAVLFWSKNDGDVYRRLSSDSGATWGSTLRVLDGTPSSDVDAGLPFRVDDAAMNGARVVMTATSGDSPELGGDGVRASSTNYGATWTTEVASTEAGDARQVAFTKAGSVVKLAEAWLRVQGATYPYALRYHRQT